METRTVLNRILDNLIPLALAGYGALDLLIYAAYQAWFA